METNLERVTRERDEALAALASATDLANTWARESGVDEAKNERSLPHVIDRLWSHWSSKIHLLAARDAQMKRQGAIEALRRLFGWRNDRIAAYPQVHWPGAPEIWDEVNREIAELEKEAKG
jgi:hypothetical protein